jgi:parallel beta-helix repeat protein
MKGILKANKKYLMLFSMILSLALLSACGGVTPTSYTITATAGAGGSISPSGAVMVSEGSNQTFTITPDEGYQIVDILVDDISIGSVGTYNFTNIVQNHTIQVSFIVGTSEFKVYNINTGFGYNNIQAAIDTALNGHAIIVYPGIFYENIKFVGKSITVRSSDPSNPDIVSVTIIDGGGSGSVVWFDEGDTSILEGFTIRNGNMWPGGGGIFLQCSNPTIKNNTITGNTATNGGGIYIYDGNPVIENNIISENISTASGTIPGIGDLKGCGGGICSLYSSPTIKKNTIIGNTADSAGGIYIAAGTSNMSIKDNNINYNTAKYCGGIMLATSSPTLTGNTIVGNTITGDKVYFYDGNGSAIYMHSFSSPTIENNTISENITELGNGSVIYITYNSDPIIKNNTITGNIAGSGGGIYVAYLSSPNINSNTISSNTAAAFGGGIVVSNYSNPTITSNNINSNTAMDGGGIFVGDDSNSIITYNTITGNVASNNGGGIRVNDGNPTIKNNIIESNMAGYQGGGICLLGDSSPIITMNTIANNKAENLGGGIYEYSYGSPVIGGTDDGDIYDFNTICGNTPNQIEPLYPNNFISTVCD